jgi:hypothetical protein
MIPQLLQLTRSESIHAFKPSFLRLSSGADSQSRITRIFREK